MFLLMIHTYCVILGVILPLLLAQNFRTNVLTTQKLLLECLEMARIQIQIIFEGHFIRVFKYSNICAHHWCSAVQCSAAELR